WLGVIPCVEVTAVASVSSFEMFSPSRPPRQPSPLSEQTARWWFGAIRPAVGMP
ncbi:osm1, partial [Symbiodinium pilosum]